jgi:fructose-1,6-bisphosphatase/inositol monophosphatase family enzyme
MSWQYRFHSGDLIVAEKKAGVTFNGQPAKANPWVEDFHMMLSRRLSQTDQRSLPDNRRHQSAASIIDYARLVFNGADIPLHTLMYRTTHPWDHAAGVLMAEELGLCAARLDGSRYRWNDITAAGLEREGLLIAPPEKWNIVLQSIYPNVTPESVEKLAFAVKL